MSDGDTVGLLAGSGEETSVPEGLGPCGVLRHVVVGVVREPHDDEVTELVRDGCGAVVQGAGRGHPPGGLVCEDDQLVLTPLLVLDKVDGLLHIAADDPLADRLGVHHEVRDVLVLALPQQFLPAQVIQS